MANRKASKYCAAYGCLNNNRNVNFSFFTLPKDIERCQEWLALVNREDLLTKPNFIPESYYVCSAHFNDSSFKKCGLKTGSLPNKISPDQLQEGPSRTDAQASLQSQSKVQIISDIKLKTSTTASRTSQTEPLQHSEKETQTFLTAKTTRERSEELRNEPGNDKSGERHEGFTCNSCSGAITGFRYTCVQCSDYDLCSSCEARGAHCLHYVLRIPKPAPFAEIQCVLSKIRAQLLYGVDLQPEHDTQINELPEDTIKVEIKEEIPDPLETEGNAFQADDHSTETNKEHCVPTDQTQPSLLLKALTLTETDKNLLIIENPVSASSAAAHRAAAADGIKRKLVHRSTAPHVSEKRVRLTPQTSANQFIEVPLTGTVPVTTVPQSPAAVLVTTVPPASTTVPVTAATQAATTSASGGIVMPKPVVVKEESSFQVFSHSAKIPQDQAQAKSTQTTGKASACSKPKKKSATNK